MQIAQVVTEEYDYEGTGWIVGKYEGDEYFISSYSHCSCYGTWDPEASGYQEWTGNLEDLLKMARERRDPLMPERTITPEDCDYDALVDLYGQVLKWAEENVHE